MDEAPRMPIPIPAPAPPASPSPPVSMLIVSANCTANSRCMASIFVYACHLV